MASIKDFSNVLLGDLIGNLCHHRNFLRDKDKCEYILFLSEKLAQKGLEEYLREEYPPEKPSEELIIVNNIGGKLYVPNGNTHLVSMVLRRNDLSIGHIIDVRPQALRYWEAGYEEDAPAEKRQYMPYPIYVSRELDAPWIPNKRFGYDNFRQPPIPILEIPANIPFDSLRWDEEVRGRPIFETALALCNMR